MHIYTVCAATNSPATVMWIGSLFISASFVTDTQTYSVLFTGALTNMFVPLRSCPGSCPELMLGSVNNVLFTLHSIVPVTPHVSLMGSEVWLGKYVILFGISVTII